MYNEMFAFLFLSSSKIICEDSKHQLFCFSEVSALILQKHSSRDVRDLFRHIWGRWYMIVMPNKKQQL